MTDGLSPGVQPSIRMTASSAGSLCRTSWIFASCSRVETIADLRARVLEDVVHLHGRERRVDRNGDCSAGQDGQVGHHPVGPALGHNRDAIAGRDAERPQPERQVADALEEAFARDRLDPIRTATPHQPGILKPARGVKRQVGDGVEVGRRDLIHSRCRGCFRHVGIIAVTKPFTAESAEHAEYLKNGSAFSASSAVKSFVR